MISLLSLPISTIRLIFTRFLKIKDISRLDVAYCNHDERDHLLHILSDNKYIIYDNVVMKGDYHSYHRYTGMLVINPRYDVDYLRYINSALIWIGKRKVNILNLSIQNQDSLTYVGLVGLSQHCKYLQSLTIERCPNISGNSIVELSKKCSTNLQALSLSDCSGLHDIHVVDFISNCSNIRSLDLSHLKELNDTGIILIARTLQRNLKSLDLECCNKISDFGLIEMGKLCSLEKLTVSYRYDETPQEFLKFRDFDKVLKFFSNLLSLTIEGSVTNGVHAIGKYCTNLHSLKLLDGQFLEVSDFVNIDSLCSNLQCIELGGFDAFSKLRRLLPNLQIIDCDNYDNNGDDDDDDDDSDNNDNDNDD